MAVAAHLGIQLDEYDARIRSFIPDYDTMLAVAAASLGALGVRAPHILDLGTGTGALAVACLRAVPEARVTIVDEDPGILAVARERLAAYEGRVTATLGSFVDRPLPACHAIVGSLTFHHLRTADLKQRVYRRLRDALVANGLFVCVDCCPSSDPLLALQEHAAWRAHLRQAYSETEADGYFEAWGREDVYVPLGSELALLANAGFAPDVAWRRGAFAVLVARRP